MTHTPLKLCRTGTFVDGKLRQCQLEEGHGFDHATAVDGRTVRWAAGDNSVPDERQQAAAIADRLLDVPYADPDDDVRVLCRQFERSQEELVRLRAGLTRIGECSLSYRPVVERLLAGESIERIARGELPEPPPSALTRAFTEGPAAPIIEAALLEIGRLSVPVDEAGSRTMTATEVRESWNGWYVDEETGRPHKMEPWVPEEVLRAGDVKPTAKLRFVSRRKPVGISGIAYARTVLEQWWETDAGLGGQWRQVEKVDETGGGLGGDAFATAVTKPD